MVTREIYFRKDQSEMIHDVMDIIIPNEYTVWVEDEKYEKVYPTDSMVLIVTLHSQKDWEMLKKYFPKPEGRQLPGSLNLTKLK